MFFFFFSSRRRHTRSLCDWSSDVCSSDLANKKPMNLEACSSQRIGGLFPVEAADSTVGDENCSSAFLAKRSAGRSEERRVGKSVGVGGGRVSKKKREI